MSVMETVPSRVSFTGQPHRSTSQAPRSEGFMLCCHCPEIRHHL